MSSPFCSQPPLISLPLSLCIVYLLPIFLKNWPVFHSCWKTPRFNNWISTVFETLSPWPEIRPFKGLLKTCFQFRMESRWWFPDVVNTDQSIPSFFLTQMNWENELGFPWWNHALDKFFPALRAAVAEVVVLWSECEVITAPGTHSPSQCVWWTVRVP